MDFHIIGLSLCAPCVKLLDQEINPWLDLFMKGNNLENLFDF